MPFCSECGKRIENEAKACPFCGVPQGRDSQHRIAAFIFLVVTLAVAAVYALLVLGIVEGVVRILMSD